MWSQLESSFIPQRDVEDEVNHTGASTSSQGFCIPCQSVIGYGLPLSGEQSFLGNAAPFCPREIICRRRAANFHNRWMHWLRKGDTVHPFALLRFTSHIKFIPLGHSFSRFWLVTISRKLEGQKDKIQCLCLRLVWQPAEIHCLVSPTLIVHYPVTWLELLLV